MWYIYTHTVVNIWSGKVFNQSCPKTKMRSFLRITLMHVFDPHPMYYIWIFIAPLTFIMCSLMDKWFYFTHALVLHSSISIWTVNKKKPVSTVKQAHGSHGNTGLEQPYWVSSVAALHNSDVVASGASGAHTHLHTTPGITHGQQTHCT